MKRIIQLSDAAVKQKQNPNLHVGRRCHDTGSPWSIRKQGELPKVVTNLSATHQTYKPRWPSHCFLSHGINHFPAVSVVFFSVMGVLRDHLSQAVTSLEEKQTSFRIFQNNTHHLDRLVGHQFLHLLALWKSLHHRKNGGREKRKSLQTHRRWRDSSIWLTNSTTSSLTMSLHPLYFVLFIPSSPRTHPPWQRRSNLPDHPAMFRRPQTALIASLYGFACTHGQKTYNQSATLTEAAKLPAWWPPCLPLLRVQPANRFRMEFWSSGLGTFQWTKDESFLQYFF